MDDDRLVQRQANALAFLVAGVTLALQILAHRVVSAKLLNNFAFLIISLTMLGFALSGVLLTAGHERFQRRLREHLGLCAAGLVLTTLGAVAMIYGAYAGSQHPASRPELVASFLGNLPTALLLAVPFTFCGLILGGLLSSPHLDTRRIYGFDLIGSALGAILVVPAIGALGVERALGVSCAVLLTGVALIAPPRGRWARAALLVAGTATAVVGIGADRVLVLRYPEGSMLAGSESAQPPFGVEMTRWDPVARIEVSRIAPPDPDHCYFPCLLGTNRAFLARIERMLTQNNFAYTYAVHWDGQPASLRGIEETIYAAAYHASSVKRPTACVIGVGGGFDLLTALAFDARDITGVDVNSATLSILRDTPRYRDYFRAWVDDPRVHLVLGDGRHHLAATDDRFDVIQLSGVDSYAGTPGAAHVFSESYLYTAEAFDLYLSRLTDEGVLNVMRLEAAPPREMLKVLVTAMEALWRRGVAEPRKHIMVVSASDFHFVSVLVKPTPFTPAEVERVRDWTKSNPYLRLAAGPGVDDGPNAYAAALAFSIPYTRLGAGAGPLPVPERFQREIDGYPYAIEPATDDRPFFFRHSYWWHLFPASAEVWATSIPAMEYSVVILLAIVGAVTVACVYLPLRLLAGRGVVRRGSWRDGVYFAGCALGYMAVEVALLQKLGLHLGHPNHALSVVLASLLLWSGVGSLMAPSLIKWLRGIRGLGAALVVLLLLLEQVALPATSAIVGWSFPARALTVMLLILPIGVSLGAFMPFALDGLKRQSGAYVPWAWGVNGIFSVMAPLLGVACSMTFGIDALLLSAVPIYLLVAFVHRAPPGVAPAPASA